MSVVITGSPGTGKHSVAERLAGTLDMGVVDLTRVAAEAGLGEAVDADRLAAAVLPMLAVRSIVVGHLAPYAVRAGDADAVIVLRRDPRELERVYAERGYGAQKSKENLGAEVLGIIAHDAAARFGARITELDTTARGADETARRAERAIAGRAESDRVDWLAGLSGEADMRRFFEY